MTTGTHAAAMNWSAAAMNAGMRGDAVGNLADNASATCRSVAGGDQAGNGCGKGDTDSGESGFHDPESLGTGCWRDELVSTTNPADAVIRCYKKSQERNCRSDAPAKLHETVE